MSTWTKFYVNTPDKEALVGEVMRLSSINSSSTGDFPANHRDSYLSDVRSLPDHLLVGRLPNDWMAVWHNSFSKLENWGVLLSKRWACKVIIIQAQSVSDAYYFALYEKGVKAREIEVCYSDDSERLNFGNRFDFEEAEPGKREVLDGDTEYVFDFDSIKEYCKHFGLDIESEQRGSLEWTILKKPRWKFWG